MKVSAGSLFRRAAGMENGSALLRREARKFQFLERRGRHGGNWGPVLDSLRRPFLRLADFSVSQIVPELEHKQFERQGIEIFVGADVRRLILSTARLETPYVVSYEKTPAQMRGKVRKFFVHAVFVWLVFRHSRPTLYRERPSRQVDCRRIYRWWYILQLSVGRAYSRAGSSVASPHHTVALPFCGAGLPTVALSVTLVFQ